VEDLPNILYKKSLLERFHRTDCSSIENTPTAGAKNEFPSTSYV
jgi:hypothetical protein